MVVVDDNVVDVAVVVGGHLVYMGLVQVEVMW